MKDSSSIVMLSVASLVGLVACGDPGGPGASGNVLLGAGIKTDTAQTLIVRGVPDTGSFDSAKPVFDVPPPTGERAWDIVTTPAMGLTFPYHYTVGESLGTTEQQRWRVFAWLSASTDAATKAPASGEAFGTATFSVVSCQQYGGYCQTTEGVDVTISQVAP